MVNCKHIKQTKLPKPCTFVSLSCSEAEWCQVRFRPQYVGRKTHEWAWRAGVFKHPAPGTLWVFCWEDCPMKITSIQTRGGSVDTNPRQRQTRPAVHCQYSLCCFKKFGLVSPPSLPLCSNKFIFLYSKLFVLQQAVTHCYSDTKYLQFEQI